MNHRTESTPLNRRRFLHTAVATGVSLAYGSLGIGQTPTTKQDDNINVALIGAGAQGKALIDAAIHIPGIRFQAVCDIWPYNRNWIARRFRAYGHGYNSYEDYREMLDKEKDLHAVIVATPDFWHAEHTIACLNAGLHVYCEKEMSNTLTGARRMVQAARQTGKLLQIGHQRRSNPRYIFCRDTLLKGAKLLGQIIAVNGQWNRAVQSPLGWPKKYEMDPATLARYGYKSMHQFRNWRWFKGLGGGPIVDLGSHQIDIYNWFLDAQPTSVIASGRLNYYDPKTYEWYDTVMAIYEYQTSEGSVTAHYQTISANSSRAHFEMLMGHEGTLQVSEIAARCGVYREKWVDEDKWKPWVTRGYLSAPEIPQPEPPKSGESFLDVRESEPAPRYKLLVEMNKPAHQPHLENFFDAIAGKAKLSCPAEIGYETAVSVLKVNEAIEAERKLSFKQEDFVV